MLGVKCIDQSLVFNISFSNGSDNINFTLKKGHYMWERRRRVITYEKEGALHMRKKGHYTWERRVIYMWERRVITCEKEGSLHVRTMCGNVFVSHNLYIYSSFALLRKCSPFFTMYKCNMFLPDVYFVKS